MINTNKSFLIKLVYWMSFLLTPLVLVGASFEGKKRTVNDVEHLVPTAEEIKFNPPLAGQDELERTLPQIEDVGKLKENRQVGIFYFLWQGDEGSLTSEKYWDLSEIIPQHPEVLEDGKSELWGSTERGFYYFW